MNNLYKFTKNSQILIYGCGIIGREICKSLKKDGYCVVGFIDKRYKEVSILDGVPVYGLEEINLIHSIKDLLVIISLMNGMEHELIAQKLAEKGAQNIVYLPMHLSGSYEDRKKMRNIYKKIICHSFNEVVYIPVYEKKTKYLSHTHLIDMNEENSIFWCPIEDVELNGLDVTYELLFKWLDGEAVDITDYLILVGRDSRELKTQWLESRKKLYDIYNDSLQYDLTFFSDAPSLVKWNSSGSFSVIDGLTRMVFLIYKGYREVPVLSSLSDYQQWMCKNENGV